MIGGVQVEAIDAVSRRAIERVQLSQAVSARSVCLEVAASLLITGGKAGEMRDDFRPANAERAGVSMGHIIGQARQRIVAAAVVAPAVVHPARKVTAGKDGRVGAE